ncbi:MAG: hypothetical protein ACXIVQ_05395 [Acidimicrobiales bacterium]
MAEQRAALRIDGSGERPAVTKRAPSPAVAARLRHEADMLRLVQIPGVVTLIGLEDEPVTLRTRFCASRTLASAAPHSLPRAAGIVAALATTVAEVHERGVVHHRITADHVLLDPDGRPVLCGFAEASTDTAHAADDVRALGMLLTEMVRPLPDEVPIPTQRVGRRGNWAGYQRRALLNVADQAASDGTTLTAAGLARSIIATVPDAAMADPGAGAAAEQEHERRRPSVRLLACAGAIAAAAVAFAGSALLRADSPAPVAHHAVDDQPSPGSAGPLLPPPSTTTTPAEPEDAVDAGEPVDSAIAHPALGCGASPGIAATTASGRDCTETLAFDRGILTVGDETFEVDIAEASIAIGDFRCDGEARPALLDLESGDVVVFPGWANPETEVVATAVDRIDGARRLLAEPTGPFGCHRLVALDRFGLRHVIDTDTDTDTEERDS